MASSPRRLAMLPGLLALVAASAYAQCGPRFIDGTTGDDLAGANDCRMQAQALPCKTIQQGVNAVTAACAGDTVNVAGGPPYVQQITIGTSLNLIGAGAATTIISAPSPLTGNPGG